MISIDGIISRDSPNGQIGHERIPRCRMRGSPGGQMTRRVQRHRHERRNAWVISRGGRERMNINASRRARHRYRTAASNSSPGRPSVAAAQPTRSGRGPNRANTQPSRSGPGRGPPSTRQPRAPPGRSAAEGAVIPPVSARCCRANRRHAGQLSEPPVSVGSDRSGWSGGGSPMSTAQSARRMVRRSCGSSISSWRRNSAQAPSGVSQK